MCVFSKYILRSGTAGSFGCCTAFFFAFFFFFFLAFWTKIWHYCFLPISYYNKDKMVYRLLKSTFRDYIYSIILHCKWCFKVLLQLANLIKDCLKVYIFTYSETEPTPKTKGLSISEIKKRTSKRMCYIKVTFCPYIQPTVSSHSFLNSGKRICILIYIIPLDCLLTSQKLLSTTLCRYLVKKDLVQLPEESVITPLYLPSATDGLTLSTRH